MVGYRLNVCKLRIYYDADISEFSNSKRLKYARKLDYPVDMRSCNFKKRYETEFNCVSFNKFIIPISDVYIEEDYVVLYILFRVNKNEIIYGISDVTIEFNPSQDVLLYYRKIKLNKKFSPRIIKFYFDNNFGDFYDEYTDSYYCVFDTHPVYKTKPNIRYTIFNIQSYYDASFFDSIIIPRDFQLTNSIIPRNRNIEYNYDNPQSMFTGDWNTTDSELSYMYINNVRMNFNPEQQTIKVQPGEYVLYYSPNSQSIGIKYIKKRRTPDFIYDTITGKVEDTEENRERYEQDERRQQREEIENGQANPGEAQERRVNPVYRSNIYLKQLTNINQGEEFRPITVDFFNKDNGWLYRLDYTYLDERENRDKYLLFSQLKDNFESIRRDNLRRQRRREQNRQDREYENAIRRGVPEDVLQEQFRDVYGYYYHRSRNY